MIRNHYLVTGGAGFLGSALVRRLVHLGHRVRVLDDQSRGSAHRLNDLTGDVEFIQGDVRDATAVDRATAGVHGTFHLAFINGTELFYTEPELVLDVGVKGIVNVLDACKRHHTNELILASSPEVYQTPPTMPTDEAAPFNIPDPFNPRYSYAASKIISEIMAINYGRRNLHRLLIFRPHNVYGPDMGREHVIPHFVLRMKELAETLLEDPIEFPIQGTGKETRSFVYIDDFIDGLMLIAERGQHMNIYNIGTAEEMAVDAVAHEVARCFGRRIRVVPGGPSHGGTPRRCPDISKLTQLGYRPKVRLAEGLPMVARWYASAPLTAAAAAAER